MPRDERFKFYALKLTVLIVFIFGLQVFIPGFTELFLLDQGKIIEVWRFVTSIFLHGGMGHLLYNGFALALFGSILEGLVGSRKFLITFLLTGVLANIFSVWFYSSSLGASGAIFGVIGALVLVRPLLVVWAFGMPMPMFIAGLIWAVGDLIGAAAFLSGNPMSNTGNLAHLGGMFAGLILGFFYRERQIKKKKEKVLVDEDSMRAWENIYLR